MNYILVVKLGIRTIVGHHIHAAVDVRNIYVASSLALTNTLPFAVPFVWRKRKDHLTDCNCLTKIDGHNSGSKHTVVYPIIPSAPGPVEHDGSVPVPKPPQQLTLHAQEPINISLWILISQS